MDQAALQDISKLLRYYILTSTTAAGSGHPSSSLSSTDLMNVLFFGGFLKTDLDHHEYENNDRLIFSKGHGAPLLYSLYAAAGKLTEDELMTLRHIDSPLEGHPSMRFAYSECASGSLGMGLGVGVGMALAAKKNKLSYRTFVLLGDSELAEGSIWEAVASASYYELGNLVGIVDVNRLGQRGPTMHQHDLAVLEQKFSAFGAEVYSINDGHDLSQIKEVYDQALASQSAKPKIILAKTLKGKGVKVFEDKEGWHARTLSWEQLDAALNELGVINKEVTFRPAYPEVPDKNEMKSNKAEIVFSDYELGKEYASREGLGNFLEKNLIALDDVAVLDAEVSNSTFSDRAKKVRPESFYEMFVAEGNMMSVATGMSRRGLVPFVCTFAAFMTRGYDQIRMSQYSHSNIKFVSSHAGISLAPDGASQMGLEDVAMFRTLRGSVVLVPADALSSEKLIVEAYKHKGNVYVRTSKMAVPAIYKREEDFPIGGSKVLRQSENDIVTLVSAGVTLHEALKAHEQLKGEGVNIRVIDTYSIKPLDKKTLNQACFETRALLTIEDHYPEGGLYEAVASSMNKNATPVYGLAVMKEPHTGKPEEVMEQEKINAAAIVAKVKKIIEVIN